MSTVKISVDKSIDKAVAEFKKSDMVIATMAATYMPLKIDGAEDRKGYIAVREARMEVKGLRVNVEHKRKELKEDALKYGKAVDDEAKRLKALIEPIESHLQKQEDDYEKAKEKIKADKAAATAAKLQVRVERFTEARCPLPDLAFLSEIDDGNFELFFDKAVETQREKDRIAQIEADRVEAERAAIKAEQDRIDAEAKAEADRIAAEERAELIRKAEENRLERERLAAERERIAAEQKAEQARHDEANRAERERMEAERAELKRQAEELRAKQEADRLRIESENAELVRKRDEALRKADEIELANREAEAFAKKQREVDAFVIEQARDIWERTLLNLTIDVLKQHDRNPDEFTSESWEPVFEHWKQRQQ